MEKIQPTRKQIIEDVRIWSKHFLEVPNLHLGGVPACPFAKKAWLDKKVWVAVKTKNSTYKKELNDCLKNLDFTKKEILIFCDPYFSYSPDELHVATEDFNEWYNRKDFYFMSFHPSNPATEEEQKFLVSPNNDTNLSGPDYKYSMMLVQKFSQLQEASDKLHKQGYYEMWPDEYYQEVVVSRANKYKKINGGLS
jgi:hypothetical protein|tara:strand:+ start:309 stop:893 length:585 start_codon:yes stop_codon:yes gene_type:complete